MRKLNRGEILTKTELQEIATNYCLTYHAKDRMKERGIAENQIKDIILNPLIAYFNTDYSINIAQDQHHYFVIIYNENQNKYVIVTYKEPSYNGKSIFEKHEMATKGKDRIKVA